MNVHPEAHPLAQMLATTDHRAILATGESYPGLHVGLDTRIDTRIDLRFKRADTRIDTWVYTQIDAVVV
jgi:hypothetical protein